MARKPKSLADDLRPAFEGIGGADVALPDGDIDIELPDDEGEMVDGALVKEPEQALAKCRAAAVSQFRELGAAHAGEVRAFAERFQREHGFLLDFESEAIAAVAARAQREGLHVEAMCAKLFKDYPFGLKLVTRSTGATSFVITPDAIANPDKYVSELVVNACRSQPEPVSNNIIDITPDTPAHES